MESLTPLEKARFLLSELSVAERKLLLCEFNKQTSDNKTKNHKFAPWFSVPVDGYKGSPAKWQHTICEVTFSDSTVIRCYAMKSKESQKYWDVGTPTRAAIARYRERHAPPLKAVRPIEPIESRFDEDEAAVRAWKCFDKELKHFVEAIRQREKKIAEISVLEIVRVFVPLTGMEYDPQKINKEIKQQ